MHLLLVGNVELVVIEGQIIELIEIHVGIADTLIAGRPKRTVGIGSAPGTIEEALNGVTRLRIDRLIGGR